MDCISRFGAKDVKGIYPVYLFYRELELLILAYGISESNQTNQVWANPRGAVTIADMFSERFGAPPKRSGSSLVFSAYDSPDNIDAGRLTDDLNKLIFEYESQLGEAPPPPPQDTELASHSPVFPYGLNEAMEGVFLDEEAYTSIVRTWERSRSALGTQRSRYLAQFGLSFGFQAAMG